MMSMPTVQSNAVETRALTPSGLEHDAGKSARVFERHHALYHRDLRVSCGAARTFLIGATVVAAIAGYTITGAECAAMAVSNAGDDLTRLLRMMATLKTVMALAAAAAVMWRFGSPVSPPRLAAYAVACAAMSAGPGLIWTMAHVGLGALLLHGGLAGTLLLLWNDPTVTGRLAEIIDARRLQIRR